MSYTRLALVAVLGFLGSCASTLDERIDPDAPDVVGNALIDSRDFVTMADRMSKSLAASGVLDGIPATQKKTFYITDLRNESSQPELGGIAVNMIRTEVFKTLGNRVDIIDRSAEGADAIRRERDAKRAGAVTANPDLKGDVLGSDYLLKGRIQDQVKSDGRYRSRFYVFTFELTSLETGKLAWIDNYTMKSQSEKSVISN